MTEVYEFSAPLWRWEATTTAWFFVSLPEDVTDEIDERYGRSAAGFGSLPVEVTVGGTTWRTSIFPDTKRGCFVLPVKKAVRTKEKLDEGSVAQVALSVRVQ